MATLESWSRHGRTMNRHGHEKQVKTMVLNWSRVSNPRADTAQLLHGFPWPLFRCPGFNST